MKKNHQDLFKNISELQQELNAKDLNIQKLSDQLKSKSILVADTSTLPTLTQPTATTTMSLGNSNEVTPITKRHLRELYSQDERKSIPIFKGKRGEQLVNNWLKDAERVAQSAGWEKKDKIKYFYSRSKHRLSLVGQTNYTISYMEKKLH